MSQHRIFVYGTLQYPDVAQAVTGQRLEGHPARLDGYARYQVRRAPFPGIVPAHGRSVEGLIYAGIDAHTLAHIDAFEGSLYRRESVTVVLVATNARAAAQAYVVRPRYRSRLAARDWDEHGFLRDWHAVYAGHR